MVKTWIEVAVNGASTRRVRSFRGYDELNSSLPQLRLSVSQVLTGNKVIKSGREFINHSHYTSRLPPGLFVRSRDGAQARVALNDPNVRNQRSQRSGSYRPLAVGLTLFDPFAVREFL
jgi:hypothetical protein